MIFGKPVEREAGSPGQYAAGKSFRVLQASRVVIGGKNVTVNDAYSDPKDKGFEWCETKVEKPGPAMTVLYSEAPYKLSLDKGAGIFVRGDGDAKRDLKKGAKVIVLANAVSEKPDGEEERPVYKAERAIFMEGRLLRWYEALLP
jgi:hypothetical protein